MRICHTAIVLLATLLALPVWAQTAQSQSSPSNNKTVDQLGLEVQDPRHSQSPEGARHTSPAPEKTISPQEAKELFKSVDDILDFASRETKLPIKEVVKRRLVERNEVQSYIQTNMKEDKDAQRLERSEIVLKKFGLLPRNFDLQTFLVALLKEQVAGYYDPKTKTVNLLNWVDADSQRPVLAHELTHALQDQSFSLQKWMKKGEKDLTESKKDPTPADIENDEMDNARQAVVEGQAEAVMVQYALAPVGRSITDSPELVDAMESTMINGTPDSTVFKDAPIFLKESLTFPYSYGMEFVVKVLQKGGKERAFADVLRNPPHTTRQIMEPETYLSGEKIEPMRVVDFAHDFKDYLKFDIGAMGEFDVAVLIEQYAGKDLSKRLYPEWRGGYYYAAKPKADAAAPLGLMYVSRWSRAEKAAEFAAIYARSLEKRYKKVEEVADSSTDKGEGAQNPEVKVEMLKGRHAWSTEEGAVVIEEEGDTVLVSESIDPATTRQLEKEVFGTSK